MNEVLAIDTLVFDESQITCPTNASKPKVNGLCHSLTNEAGRTAVVITEHSESESEADDSLS